MLNSQSIPCQLAAGLLLSLAVFVTSSQATLIAYYPVDDGTANDFSGSPTAHNGTLQNSASIVANLTRPNSAPGNQVLSLSRGTSDFVNVSASPELEPDTGAFSIAGWIHVTNATIRQDIAGKQATSGNFDGWAFRISQTAGTRQLFGLMRQQGASNLITATGGTALADNTWYHVGMTYDGSGTASGISIYIDGVAESLTGGGTSVTDIGSSVSFNLGDQGTASASALTFGGLLDDLAIFNQQLTPGQMANLASGFATPLNLFTIPEPSTFLLAGFGALLLANRRGGARMLKRTLHVALAWLMLFFISPSATDAATVLIDWSDAAAITNPAGDGKYWNTLGVSGAGNDLTATSLISSVNGATPWQVAVNNPGTTTGFGGTGVDGPAGADPFDEANAVIDGIFNNNTALTTITFTGLIPNSLYAFSAIGGRASGGVDGTIAVTTGTGVGGILLNNGTILDFSITPDLAGAIALTFADNSGGGAGAAGLNALSITGATALIPEPTTMFLALMGICVGASCRIRRLRDHRLARLCVALVGSAAMLLTVSEANARSINVNFALSSGSVNDNNGVDLDETATSIFEVSGANWNNLLIRNTGTSGSPTQFIAATTGGNSIALKDDHGNTSAAQLTSTIAPGGGFTNFSSVSGGSAGATGEAGLFQSFLNFGGSAPAETLVISGLGDFTAAADGYDVILYMEGNQSRTYGFTINDGITSQTIWGSDSLDNSDSNDDGTIEFKQALGTSLGTANSANYLIFENLRGSSFTISALTDTGRASINGFQILLPVPEPSTFFLLASGLGFVAARRTRRSRRA